MLEKLVQYSMPVDGWSYYYSYIAEPRTRTEVDEFIHLETLDLHGKLMSPHRQSGRELTIMIACEKAPVAGQATAYDRPVLGNLDGSKKILVGYLLLPADHVTRMVSVVASERPIEVRLAATKMYRRKAFVRSVTVIARKSSGMPSHRSD